MLGPDDYRGITNRGPEPGVARVSREELECHVDHIEVHECDCGNWVATCRIHDTEAHCDVCGCTW